MQVMMRFSIGACVALLANGCDGGRSAPTAPTATPTNPGPTVALHTVAGVVSDGAAPVEGASISAWISEGRFGYSYTWAHGPLRTDAAGRYQLAALPAHATVWLQSWKDGYVQQCAAPPLTLLGDATVDVQMVSRARLSASTVEAPPAGFRSVSGVIYETTAAGRRPFAGAFVDFEPVMDFSAAVTYTDASGRYLLCGVPEGQTGDIVASLGNNRVASAPLPPGQSTGIDITFP